MDQDTLDFLENEIEEDCGITNLDIIDRLYKMLIHFYDVNGLIIEDQAKLYNNFVKFVLIHSK